MIRRWSRSTKSILIRIVPYFLLLLIVLPNSCTKKPVFIKVGSVVISSLKDSILEAEINLKVFNPNGINSTITASKINTFYNGIMVGSSTLNKEIALPSKDTVDIPMQSKINIWMLAKVFPELLATDSATFTIVGDGKAKSFGISFTIPIKDKIKLNVKQIVIDQVDKMFKNGADFKIKDLRLDKLPGLDKTNFQMTVEVDNSFPFEYNITNINLDIYRKNGHNAIGNWKLSDTIYQKINTRSEIPVKIEIDNFKLLGDIRLADIFNPNLDFILKGEAEISIQGHAFTIPIQEARKVTFNPISGFNL